MAKKMPNVWTRKCSDDHRGDFQTDQTFSETNQIFVQQDFMDWTGFKLNFLDIDYRFREVLLYVLNVDTSVMLL